jgi:magnesium chelatase subunit I
VERAGDVQVVVPQFLRELIEEVAIQARKSEYVDQGSGVSARLPIALLENLVSNAERRGLLTGERTVVARVCDLAHAVTAVSGKVELVLEGEQEGALNVARHLLGKGIKALFGQRFPDAYKPKRGRAAAAEGEAATTSEYRPVLEWFAGGNQLEVSDEMPAEEFAQRLSEVKGLERLAARHLDVKEVGELAVGMELVIEGLHQNSMLSRDRADSGRATYRDVLKSMFSNLGTEAQD